MNIVKSALSLFFGLISTPGLAQVKCTMPNGVVITQQLGTCPRDAIKVETVDGKVLTPPARVPSTAAPKAQANGKPDYPIAPASNKAPAPRSEPSAYEYAQLICKAFEQSGATTCDVNSNILSDSTIETTIATSPRNASIACNDVAATMRGKTRVFEQKNWKILIYSPFSGNRPIAACKL